MADAVEPANHADADRDSFTLEDFLPSHTPLANEDQDVLPNASPAPRSSASSEPTPTATSPSTTSQARSSTATTSARAESHAAGDEGVAAVDISAGGVADVDSNDASPSARVFMARATGLSVKGVFKKNWQRIEKFKPSVTSSLKRFTGGRGGGGGGSNDGDDGAKASGPSELNALIDLSEWSEDDDIHLFKCRQVVRDPSAKAGRGSSNLSSCGETADRNPKTKTRLEKRVLAVTPGTHTQTHTHTRARA